MAKQPPEASAEVRGLGHVTVAEVSKRTGMTRGSLYHLWPTQEAYRFDLMRSIHPGRSAAPDAGSSVAGTSSIAEEVEAAVRVAIADVGYRSSLSFHPYSRSDAARGLASECASAVVEPLLRVIHEELARSRRRLRDEFDDDHLRSTISALVQGIAVLGLMHQQRHSTADVDALVVSAQESVDAVLMHFTVPMR